VQPLLQWKSKNYYITEYGCLKPLFSGMQCACDVLSSVACGAVRYFSTLSYKRHVFERKKVIDDKMHVFLYSLKLCLKQTFLIRGRIERNMIKNICRSSREVPVILVRFFIKLEFSRQIFYKYSNFKFHDSPSSGSRIVPCGQTDR
jgi:hypothetical protein